MNSLSRGTYCLRRKVIFNFWRSSTSKDRLNKVIGLVKSQFGVTRLAAPQDKHFKAIMKNECEKIRYKWYQKRRKLNKFLEAYKDWLEEDILFDMINVSSIEQTPGPSLGRPKKQFQQSSSKTKKRRVQHLLKEYDHEQLSFAAQASIRSTGKRDAASLMSEISTSSPQRATNLKKTRKRNFNAQEGRPYTSEEALALFVSNKFTVQQYKNVQQEAKERGFPLYPSYQKILKEKENCYPSVENIIVTDLSAEVNLQALLNHTAMRICGKILEEFFSRPGLSTFHYTLMYKWGCDGSSGHSLYKQKFDSTDFNSTDEYMFIVSMVPIRLVTNDIEQKLIWENPRASSPRFCRIIKFLYKKETDALIKEEYKQMENQIKEILPVSVKINNIVLNISHKLILSMIDGKICNVLSNNKSTQRCFICKATAKEMNLSIVHQPDEDMYQFGISSLHAYIRTLECMLSISYRMLIKEWQIRGQTKKDLVKARKEDIKKKFKEVGLIIDKVKPGYGTSNDGNTARRFFSDCKSTANITGIDENLIYRLSIILKVIASGYEIDCEKFGEYCYETRNLYLSLYPWYNMPVTLHKILVHGSEIVKNCIIPLGQMSEEASEAKNKEIRKIRLGHTCKISRVRTNYDLFKYLLLTSDPYLTLLRKLPKKTPSNCNKDFLSLIKSK